MPMIPLLSPPPPVFRATSGMAGAGPWEEEETARSRVAPGLSQTVCEPAGLFVDLELP